MAVKIEKRILKAILIALIICLVTAILFMLYLALHITNDDLTVTKYSLSADISSPLRIVHLTDLHNAEFGEDNCELTGLVADQNPDLIVMTGDMLNRDEESLGTVCGLISDLTEIAPVYFGYGNHETDWETAWERT